jgi:hypothetical protein
MLIVFVMLAGAACLDPVKTPSDVLRNVDDSRICKTTPHVITSQTGQATAAPSTCVSLSRQWQGIEQELAASYARGIADNSAPRATLRAQEETNGLLRAQMLIDMMKDNRCAVPKSPPTIAPYISAALACETDKLRSAASQLPQSCNRGNWNRTGQ